MQRILVVLFVAMLTLLSGEAAVLAYQNQSPTNSNIEERKLDIERQKLEVERTKAKWSAVSTVVPLLGVLGTLVYSVWSFRRQINQTQTLQREAATNATKLQQAAATETARLQNETAKLQFEIKAAEIAFTGVTPEAVTNRAKVLKKIFGDRLPANFPPTFEAKEHGGGKESPEEKMFFLELLLKYPGKETEIIGFWDKLFGDSWLDRVKPVSAEQVSTSAPTETSAPQNPPPPETMTPSNEPPLDESPLKEGG